MNGNACNKLLKKLSKLKYDVPRRLRKYVEALVAFEKVKKSCFELILLPSYKSDIEEFRRAYDALGVPMTNKVHILVEHVIPFCEKHEKGLGFFSEQAFEAVHADFKKTWKNYKVDESNPQFGEKLLQATLKYNFKHL